MIKNFKFISRNFALKVNKINKKCTTISYTTEFYENLITIQKPSILKLFRNKDFFLNSEFCVNAYKINSLLNDKNLDILIANKITKCVADSGIKSDSNFYSLFETFYENLKNNPSHPLTKELIGTLNKNSFLFSPEEKRNLEKMMVTGQVNSEKANRNYSYQDEPDEDNSDEELIEEENEEEDKDEAGKKKKMEEEKEPEQEATPEINGIKFMEHYAKLKLRDDNVKIYLDTGNKKVTIKSKYFKSKIKIIGIDDNKPEKILQAFNYVDKNKPNTILIHKRPVHFPKNSFTDYEEDIELEKNSKKSSKKNPKKLLEKNKHIDGSNNYYTSLLERDGIMKYCKEILMKNPEFKINTVERIVYVEKDSFKTMSYLQSLILKSNYALNVNPQIKVILTDIPLYHEIENIIKNIFTNVSPKDFLSFMKFSLLFERYLWLSENCGDRCPACDSTTKFDSIYMSLEELIDDYLLSLKGIEHIKIKNISDKILKSLQFGDFKGNNILAFVDEKYFYLVIERLVRDMDEICEGKDWDTKQKTFIHGKGKNLSDGKKINEINFEFSLGNFENLFKSILENNDKQTNHPQTEVVANIEDENYHKMKNEFLNKLAISLNIFQKKNILEKTSSNLLPELNLLKDEFSSPLQDLYSLYNEKLNFVDEINLWSNRKYDYKCFPNEILINKFLEKNNIKK
jgi:hypothetical protein